MVGFPEFTVIILPNNSEEESEEEEEEVEVETKKETPAVIHKETVTPKVEPNIETEVPLAQAQTSDTSAIKETTEEPKDEVDESSKTDNDQIENKIDSEVIATEELASVDAISEEDKEKEATDAKKDNVENVFEETPGNLNKNFVYLEYTICFFLPV